MSADNGIYIAKFTDCYRVKEAGGIDNCDGIYGEPNAVLDASRYLYFKDAFVTTDKEMAWSKAWEIEKDYGYTEYGVCMIEYDTPFPEMHDEEAHRIIAEYEAQYRREHT